LNAKIKNLRDGINLNINYKIILKKSPKKSTIFLKGRGQLDPFRKGRHALFLKK
jgi:hypothetical protein